MGESCSLFSSSVVLFWRNREWFQGITNTSSTNTFSGGAVKHWIFLRPIEHFACNYTQHWIRSCSNCWMRTFEQVMWLSRDGCDSDTAARLSPTQSRVTTPTFAHNVTTEVQSEARCCAPIATITATMKRTAPRPLINADGRVTDGHSYFTHRSHRTWALTSRPLCCTQHCGE